MNEKEMFNQKLDQIGGGEILEGISIRGTNKTKILEFINANSGYEYKIDEDGLLIKTSNELKDNANLDIKAKTFLDIEFEESQESNAKILLAFSSDNMSNDIEVYRNDDERIIILNPNSYIVDNRFIEVSDSHDENIKVIKDLLYNEELTDRLIKSFHDTRLIQTRSSTATVETMAQNQTVYHGPHLTQYATVGSVDAGEQVYILSKAFGFYHIQYIVTSTGKQKQGYIPQTSIEDFSGPNPEEENYYGGYCFATTELDVRTCDDFNLTAPVGTLFKHEGCTMIFHYNFVDGDRSYHVAYIEYSTSSGTKRGYVYNQYLSFPVSTCVAVMRERADVYAGPNSNYASIGAIAGSEFVSIIAKESDDIYVEYNTSSGRKRGYIKYSQLTPYNRPASFPDFYASGVNAYIVDERVVVYGGPNSNYTQLGAVRNEDVISYNTNNSSNYTFEYTCIEYTVSSTGQRKRGYVLASKVINGNLPEENNSIESFDNSYANFGKKIVYGQTQKGRDMFYYKCGSGKNHLFLTFALHGWEDGTKADGTDYHGDGNMLLKVAKRFMQDFSTLSSDRLNFIKNNWSIYVFPGINLDGIINGNNNNGFGRCLYNKLDPNRNWGGNFVANNTSPRYKTASTYFQATELTNLRDCLRNNIGTGKNVLLDVHGWFNQTVGSANLGKYFWNSMGIPSSRHSYSYGQGYLIAWAKNSPSLTATSSDYPGLGAESCLVELTPTTNYSNSNMQNYGDKFFNGTINLLENYPISSITPPPTPSGKNAAFITAIEKLTSAAQEYCPIALLDRTPYNRNRLILQYLREPAYNGALWLATTEAIDYNWISFAEAKTGIKVGSLKIYEDIIDDYLYVQHLAVVAETAMIRDFSSTELPYILLASAMGDLLQLGGTIQRVYNNNHVVFTVEQIKNLIRCDSDSYAQNLGFENAKQTGFSLMDWYQDIDGLNIGKLCKTDDFLSVVKEYYNGLTNKSRLNRYGMYASNLNLSDPTSSGTTSDLYKLAYSYTSGNVKLEDFFNLEVVTLFKAKFGTFVTAMWAQPLAQAFTDKFVERLLQIGGSY